jgi:hypothetical protein
MQHCFSILLWKLAQLVIQSRTCRSTLGFQPVMNFYYFIFSTSSSLISLSGRLSLVLITLFRGVQGQCSGGYIAATGDISGWGTVNGVGNGRTVTNCQECNILCDQQGNACLSTECSPTALRCNLNSRGLPDISTGYLDYVFCRKPAGKRAAELEMLTSHVPRTLNRFI